MTEKKNITEKASELRKRAEQKAVQSPENTKLLSHEETQQVLRELRVHQIELEMQNEELRKSQAELDAARARYFDLYDLAPVGYLTISEQGVVLEANLTAAILLDVPCGALDRRPFSQFILKEDQDIYYRHRKQLLESGEMQAFELRMLKKDGTAFWANLVATVAEPPSTGSTSSGQVTDGTPVCRIVISDIIERKKSAEKLQRSEAKFRIILDATPFPVAIVDLDDNRIEYWSHSANILFEHTPSTTEEWYKLAYPDPEYRQDVINRWKPFLEKARMTGQTVDTGEYRVTCKDGSVRICELYATFIEENLVVTFNDITERKKTEELLRASESEFRTLAEAMPQLVWATRSDGWNIYFNQQWVDYTGLTLEESYGHGWNKPFHPDDQKRAWDAWQNATQNEVAYSLECRLRRVDGAYRWWLIRGVPLRDASGKILKWFGTCTDIEDIKQVEEERLKLELQLRESQKLEAIGQLAGGVSHDFNNLLSVINGYSQVLLMSPDLKETLRPQTEEILQSGERAAVLTRQLLLFSRRAPLESKIINLDTVISGIEKMLRRLIKEDIIVTRNISPDLWRIKADSGSIEQMIMNLVINASDAMPDGGTLTVETENVKIDGTSRLGNHSDIKPGAYVMLSISDTGCGMEDKVKERIFEPFFTTKEAGKGTGLGLATVYGIVKQSNAHIDVQSELGKGTTFRIYFPKTADEGVGNEKQKDAAIMPKGSETILLTEDEDKLRKMLQNFLQSLGYAVIPARNGKEALETIEKHKGQIHLLLTDIVMPGMNGFELVKQARNLSPEIKLLFMSGYESKSPDTDKTMRTSGNFIQKPIVLHVLAVKLREILDGKR